MSKHDDRSMQDCSPLSGTTHATRGVLVMAEAAESLYTLGRWLVRAGQEDAFVTAWRELSRVFLALTQPPGVGTLLQSTEEPRLFYSFGPWPSLQAIEAMRLDPASTSAIRKLMDLCEVAEPGTFRLAATAGQSLGTVS